LNANNIYNFFLFNKNKNIPQRFLKRKYTYNPLKH